jgi:hypothetical protein
MRVECELNLMICKEGKDAFSETLMLFFTGCNAMTLGLSLIISLAPFPFTFLIL